MYTSATHRSSDCWRWRNDCGRGYTLAAACGRVRHLFRVDSVGAFQSRLSPPTLHGTSVDIRAIDYFGNDFTGFLARTRPLSEGWWTLLDSNQ